MKRLFLVLLVVNVLVFLWWQFGSPDKNGVSQSQIVKDGSRSLVLLSEIDKKNDVNPKDVEIISDPVTLQIKEVMIAEVDMPAVGEVMALSGSKLPITDQVACYTIGPVLDQNRVQEILADLMQLGVKVNQRIVQEPVLIGYRVYIPSLSSVEEARNMLQTLKKQGIKDSVIIRQGEYKNGISLGVFSKQDGAKRHQEAMLKKGFEAKVVDRYRNSEKYWFDIHGVNEKDRLLKGWEQISGKYPEMKKQVINCK